LIEQNKITEYHKEILRLKQQRKEIMEQKENKIMKMIKAKNELTEGIEQIIDTDLLIEKVRIYLWVRNLLTWNYALVLSLK